MMKGNSELVLLVKNHTNLRPRMRIRDIYKMLYQGILGPEHIIPSPDLFYRRLKSEWEMLEPFDSDPLYEPIRTDGKLLRINLRPFKVGGWSLDLLYDVCLETFRQKWGTKEDLSTAWWHFLSVYSQGSLKEAEHEEIEAFSSFIQKNNYPAVHHSEDYRRIYLPAYRLAAESILNSYMTRS